jgi:hypothetical protein
MAPVCIAYLFEAHQKFASATGILWLPLGTVSCAAASVLFGRSWGNSELVNSEHPVQRRRLVPSAEQFTQSFCFDFLRLSIDGVELGLSF